MYVCFAVLVSSSCSTDETVVADSDTEVETATSAHASVALCTRDNTKDEKVEISLDDSPATFDKMKHEGMETSSDAVAAGLDDTKCAKMETSLDYTSSRLGTHGTIFREGSGSVTVRKDKVDDSESRSSNIVYSQDLIVRDLNTSSTVNAAPNCSVPNFKRFRKVCFWFPQYIFHAYKGLILCYS